MRGTGGFCIVGLCLGALFSELSRASDAICSLGDRPINLSAQLPPTKDQADTFTCQAFKKTAALESALYRRDKKVISLSEGYLLAESVLEAEDVMLGNMGDKMFVANGLVNRPGAKAPKRLRARLLDGGEYISLSRLLRDGLLVQESAAANLASFTQLNDRVSRQAIAAPDRFGQEELRREAGEFRKKLLAKQTVSKESFAGFEVRDYSIAYRSDGQGDFTETEAAKAHDAIKAADYLNENAALAADFLRRQESRADAWSYDADPRALSRFFASAENQSLLRDFATARGLDPNLLVEKLRNLSAVYGILRARYPKLATFDPLRPDPRLVREGPARDCERAGADARDYALANLCAEIPLTATLSRSGGVQAGRPGQWTTFPNELVRLDHAMLLTGVQTEEGRRYFIFRNSSLQHPFARIPVDESCRFKELGVVLNAQDQRLPPPASFRPMESVIIKPEMSRTAAELPGQGVHR